MNLEDVLAELWRLATTAVQAPTGSTLVLALPAPSNSNSYWWVPLVGSAVTGAVAAVAALLAVRSFTLGHYFDRQEAVRAKTRDAVAVTLAAAWKARRACDRTEPVLAWRRELAGLSAVQDTRRADLVEQIGEPTERVRNARAELQESYDLLNLYLAANTSQMQNVKALIDDVAEISTLLLLYDPGEDFVGQVEERRTARAKVVMALDFVVIDARRYAQTPGRKPSRWYRWTDPYDTAV